MSAPRDFASDTDSSAHSDTSTSDGPAYAPGELAAIFLEFYKALTTLHYDAADLRIPPPGGWPNLTPEQCANFRSDTAVEVLRYLPYFDGIAYIHYKSRLIDYASLDRAYFKTLQPRDRCTEFHSADGYEVDRTHVICIAAGHETYGRELFLNVQDGGIIEESIRSDDSDTMDVRRYFDGMLEAYRDLKLIPCTGRVTIEAWEVGERVDEITEQYFHVRAQEGPTDLAIQYIRQLYRQHGWPDAFRRSDAQRAVDELESLMGGWIGW